MLEKNVEAYLRERVRGLGGLCWKLTSPGTDGVPDRVVVYINQIVFVELKKPKTGQLSKIQKFRIKQLKSYGHNVKVIDSKAGVDNLIKGLGIGIYEPGRV